jgi:cytoplasmic iron level regulating protein YaaA (DUF328/UPF0246 family)
MSNNYPELSSFGFNDNNGIKKMNSIFKKCQDIYDLRYNYHKQIFQLESLPSLLNYKPVDSMLYVKTNDKNKLIFNLVSSVFDKNFDSKIISNIKLVKKSNGSVDFIITFNNKLKPQKSIFDINDTQNIKLDAKPLNRQV